MSKYLTEDPTTDKKLPILPNTKLPILNPED